MKKALFSISLFFTLIIIVLLAMTITTVSAQERKIETKTKPGVIKAETDIKPGAKKLETEDLPALAPLDIDESKMAGSNFDVGVIAGTASIPPGVVKAEIRIYMDDEDSGNANNHWGWLGAIQQNRNTTFRFWKVDGRNFKPFSKPANYDIRSIYAVLKLGDYCPSGSFEISRYFDNEDDSNNNSNSGNISPNYQNKNTRLRFCVFLSGYETMNQFPDVAKGRPYGVFAPSDFSKALEIGFMHTDDEDTKNNNSWNGDSWVLREAARIMSGTRNTDMGIARVK